MRRAVGLVLAVGATFGCGADAAAPLRLEIDPAPGHRAAVIAVGDPASGPLVGWDLAASAAAPLVADLSPDDPLSVVALYYEADLDALGLDPGALERAEDGLPIPEPDEVAQVILTGEAAPVWGPLEAMPAALAAQRVVRRSPCAEFEVTASDLPFSLIVRGLEVDGDGLAWLLDDAGRLWRVPRGGQAELQMDGLPARSMLKTGSSLWLGGAGGGIVEVALDSGTATVTASHVLPDGLTVGALGVVPGASAPSYAVTTDRALYGGGPDAWRRLAAVDEDIGDPGGVLAVSPREALFGFDDGLLAYRWRDGALFEEEVPANAFRSGLNSFVFVPALGTVIGTGVGELLVQPLGTDQWARLDGAYATADVEDIEPYEDGFLYVDESGVVVQYGPTQGFCAPIAPPPGTHAEATHLAVDGADLVAAGEAEDGVQTAQIFWYRRRER